MFFVVNFVWVLWSTCCYSCPWSTLVHCLFSLLTTCCNGSLDIHLLLFQALVISRWKRLHIHHDQPKGWVIKLKLLLSTCLIWIFQLYKVNVVGWSWNNKQCLVLIDNGFCLWIFLNGWSETYPKQSNHRCKQCHNHGTTPILFASRNKFLAIKDIILRGSFVSLKSSPSLFISYPQGRE